ncbi:DUF2851 family protein [Dehalococcoides mccartyi]|nr:DUF2851 family protein [Dehalococcoides mccartyi]
MNYSVLDNRMPLVSSEEPAAFVVNELQQFEYLLPIENPFTQRELRESVRRYGKSKRQPGPEAILHVAWRNAGLERAQMRGRDGHTYSIIYGGRPGGSLGPDFTDAVVERDDGVTFRGDIEIHVRESDWRAHGHHKDPRYNGVVLHVVASESNGQAALKATGSTIPLLALNWKKVAGRRGGISKSSLNFPAVDLKPLLPVSEAGLDRFRAQAAGIALDIEAFGSDQAIWLGVLGALGYPRNKRAFRALGRRVDWEIASGCSDALVLEELLLSASGLKANASNAGAKDKIRSVSLKGSVPDWVRPWGRPANAPQARIKAISRLAMFWSEESGITKVAQQTVAKATDAKQLAAMFRPSSFIDDALIVTIGASRAAEIVVNVLLPAVFAIATNSKEFDPSSLHLKNRSVELYSSHPKLSSNSVTKEAQVALAIDYEMPKIATARDQQGLIALYREMYRHGVRHRQPRLPGM